MFIKALCRFILRVYRDSAHADDAGCLPGRRFVRSGANAA
jgi:hypothetical protein